MEHKDKKNSIERMNQIAVVGIGCRFPGGVDSAELFWRLLVEEVDAVTDIPQDRWDVKRFYDPDPRKPGKMYIRQGGFLKNKPGCFDADFFGISPREAVHLDPQQGLLMEVTWEALEDAGIPVEKMKGSNTGVYVGCFTLDYKVLKFRISNRHLIKPGTAAGVTMGMLANRISYVFDFHGPSITVDTACSSSLAAVHFACRGLLDGECDIAIAGGVNTIFVPDYSIAMCKGQLLSPNARCRTFDRDADGYVRSEGSGVIVLKLMEKAVEDNDHIYAVIRGTGINHDGKTEGISHPCRAAQEALMRKVYVQSGVNPAHVRYIEAHGTGTKAGDIVEANAIGEVLGKKGNTADRLIVGSVKTNIGHLEAASGIAGLIKTVLCLKNRAVPPNLHFKNPNPQIPLDKLGITVPTTCLELSGINNSPIIAGVNSFGYGGTNAHVILEEYIKKDTLNKVSGDKSCSPQLFPFSSLNSSRLNKQVNRFSEFLEENTGKIGSLYDIGYSNALRRSHFDYRLAVVANSQAELQNKLRNFVSGIIEENVFTGHADKGLNTKTVFVYSGMGPQWWYMGRELFETEPVFRKAFMDCDDVFFRYSGWHLEDEFMKAEEVSCISMARVSQPVNFAFQVSLTALLNSWGVVPDAVVGHSVGEITAFYVSGALSLENALLLLYHRSRIQQKAAGLGTMLAANISAQKAIGIAAGYDNRVSIAAINGASAVTFAGDRECLEEIAKTLEKKNVFFKFTGVDIAYHSCQMDSLNEELMECFKGITASDPVIPLYSTVSGNPADSREVDPDYWWRNLRQTVLFDAALNRIVDDGYRFFLEVSAHPVLTGYIREHFVKRMIKGYAFSTQKRKMPQKSTLLAAAGLLYISGYPVKWDKVYSGEGRYLKLPNTEWEREYYFNESDECREERLGPQGHPFLGTRLKLPRLSYQKEINSFYFPYISHHEVKDSVVLPGACYVEIGLALKRDAGIGEEEHVLLEGLEFHSQMAINPDKESLLHVEYDPGERKYNVFSTYVYDRTSWNHHATGRISTIKAVRPRNVNLELLKCICKKEVNTDVLYRHLAYRGLNYGTCFRNIKKLLMNTGEILIEIEAGNTVMEDMENYNFHPAIMDAGFHAMISLTQSVDDWYGSLKTYIPARIEAVKFYEVPPSNIYAYGKITNHNPDEIECDIKFFDGTGKVYMEIEKLCCKSLVYPRASQDLHMLKFLYKQKWDEYVDETTDFKEAKNGQWIVLSEDTRISAGLCAQLGLMGINTVNIAIGDSFNVIDSANMSIRRDSTEDFNYIAKQVQNIKGIIYAIIKEEAQREELFIDYASYMSIVYLMQSFGRRKTENKISLCFITECSRIVDNKEAFISPFGSSVWGLLRVISNEYPWINCRIIDTDWCNQDMEQLIRICLSENKVTETAVRGGRTYSARLEKYFEENKGVQDDESGKVSGINVTEAGKPLFKSDAAYLVTGGLSGLGLETARWLAGHGAKHIVLAGRRVIASEEASYIISSLKDNGIQIRVFATDISAVEKVKEMVDEIDNTMPPLKGVIHSAAVLEDSFIDGLDTEKFEKVMAPKALGAINLHKCLSNHDLDFFIMFSSISSVIGNPGQGNYAAANSFLDGIAMYRQLCGLPALCIDLGVVSGVGMAARRQEILSHLDRAGIKSISPIEVLNTVEYLLNQNISSIIFAGINWYLLSNTNPELKEIYRFSSFLKEAGDDGTSINADILKMKLEPLSEEERYAYVENMVTEMISIIFNIPSDRLDTQKYLQDMGLDSIMAYETVTYIKMNFSIEFNITEIIKDTSITSITKDIISRLEL